MFEHIRHFNNILEDKSNVSNSKQVVWNISSQPSNVKIQNYEKISRTYKTNFTKYIIFKNKGDAVTFFEIISEPSRKIMQYSRKRVLEHLKYQGESSLCFWKLFSPTENLNFNLWTVHNDLKNVTEIV